MSSRGRICAIAGAALLLLGVSLAQQPWSGIVAPNRAINWETAGLPPKLPDGEITAHTYTAPVRTTECASIAPEGSAATPVAPTNISSAIQTCAAGGYVLLEAGSFYLNATIQWCSTAPCATSDVTLRGSGADKTFLYFSGASNLTLGAQAYNYYDALASAPAVGATSISLAAADSKVTADTLVGIAVCTSESSGSVSAGGGWSCAPANGVAIYDTGGSWMCANENPFCSDGYGSTQTTALGAGAQQGDTETDFVTAAAGTALTLAWPVFDANIAAGSAPGIWYSYPTAYGDGIEDLSADFTSSSAQTDVAPESCYGCWITGVRIVGSVSGQAFVADAIGHCLFAYDYLYSPNGGAYGWTVGDSYGASDNLVLDNIADHSLCGGAAGPGSGNVYAYNYCGDTYSEPWFTHWGGICCDLFEGNVADSIFWDAVHGTQGWMTAFRNELSGDDNRYGNGFIQPIQVAHGSRFAALIGNVLGSSTLDAGSYENGSNSIMILGRIGMSSAYDETIPAVTMVWGNYDSYNGAVQFRSSGVPSAADAYAGYEQSLGTGNGAQVTFSGTLANASTTEPVVAGDTVVGTNEAVYAGSTTPEFCYDSGSGAWDPSGLVNGSDPTAYCSSGSVNYTTGAVSITFTYPPSSGQPVFVNYLQATTSASAYQNPVPASDALPASFFLAAEPSSWWSVWTNYPSDTSVYTAPWPPIGPDVTGGTGPGGYGYATPAQAAYLDLPVDSAYTETTGISGASWSGGAATITTSAVPAAFGEGEYHFIGGKITVAGVSPAGYDGTFIATASSCGASSCSVTYGLAPNPGSYASGGSFLWPQVDQFNAAVYHGAPASASPSIRFGPGGTSVATASRNSAEVTRP